MKIGNINGSRGHDVKHPNTAFFVKVEGRIRSLSALAFLEALGAELHLLSAKKEVCSSFWCSIVPCIEQTF